MLSEGHNRNYVKFKKCYGRGCQNYSRCLVTRIELFPSFRKRNPNIKRQKTSIRYANATWGVRPAEALLTQG